MRTGTRRIASTGWLAAGLAALVTVGCDKVQLTAPASSSITLTTPTRMLPTGGSTELSAQVIESAGTPVQNGTTVRFTTNLGRVDPVETQTRNGVATTTFYAGDVSGSAEVKATSGASGGTTGTGTGTGAATTATNAVTILIGAAAVESVGLRASTGTVPALGGTVEITATVISAGGAPLAGIPVSFTTSTGTLSTPRDVSDGNGEVKTRLTTDTTATVTATAGTKTSPPVTITAQNPIETPTITLAAPTSTTATKDAQLFTFSATVTAAPAYGSPVKFIWDFGDGVVVENQSSTITHAYRQANMVFHVTVTAVYSNGFRISASTDIQTSVFP